MASSVPGKHLTLCGIPAVIQITNAKKALIFFYFLFFYRVVLGFIWIGKNFIETTLGHAACFLRPS